MIRNLRPHTAPGKASCALFALTIVASAVETQSWVHSGQSDFEKGTLENLSLSSDGRLTLAPVFRELADPSIAYLWALASDSKGNLYTGGGSPGSSTSKTDRHRCGRQVPHAGRLAGTADPSDCGRQARPRLRRDRS